MEERRWRREARGRDQSREREDRLRRRRELRGEQEVQESASVRGREESRGRARTMGDSGSRDERRRAAPKYEGANYDLWRVRFRGWAIEYGLWEYYTGAKQRPGVLGEMLEEWDKSNQRAYFELVGALPDNLMQHVLAYEVGGEGRELGVVGGQRDRGGPRPVEAWAKIERLCHEKGLSRRLALRRQMTQLKMEKGEKVQDYWGRAEVLRRDLRACGAAVEDEEWLCSIMSGLPSDWGSVLATLDVAHLNEAALEARLLDEQDRRACAKTVADGMLNANKGYGQGGRGNGRGMRNLGRGGFGSGFGGAQGRGDYGGQHFGRGSYGRGRFQGRGQGIREQGQGWMRDQKQGGQGGEMRAPDMAPRGHCHFCKFQSFF